MGIKKRKKEIPCGFDSHPVFQAQFARQVAAAEAHLADLFFLRIKAEEPPCATVRANQVEQAANGGGLPGTVRAGKAENLAALYFEVRTTQSMNRASVPTEGLGLDCSFLDTTPSKMMRPEIDPSANKKSHH